MRHTLSSDRLACVAPFRTSGSSDVSSSLTMGITAPCPVSLSGRSWTITHSHTLDMCCSFWAATHRSPESKISAWVSQKSRPPSTFSPRGAASHRDRAARCAPMIDPASRSGVQLAVAIPVVRVGS